MADGGCLEARGLGAGVRLGNAEGLQPQLAAGDARQVALLLIGEGSNEIQQLIIARRLFERDGA